MDTFLFLGAASLKTTTLRVGVFWCVAAKLGNEFHSRFQEINMVCGIVVVFCFTFERIGVVITAQRGEVVGVEAAGRRP